MGAIRDYTQELSINYRALRNIFESSSVSQQRLEVLQTVLRGVNRLYPAIDQPRRALLADKITDHIYAEVERLRLETKRDTAIKATRHALLAERTPPRCYICGYAFSKEVQEAFLKTPGRAAPSLPALVDVFRPRLGLRDISIEIEHVVPVVQGGRGQDNLRLACGWCNKHKSARVSLYEASFTAPRVEGITIGGRELHELPNPFWVIRMLALRGFCQFQGDCGRTADDAELFVAPIDWSGSPNPTNLAIYCETHDPLAVDRMQKREDVRLVWEARTP